jgi:hypothetical protein
MFNFDDFKQINLLITQAIGGRSSPVQIVLKALKGFPRCEAWVFLSRKCGGEWQAFLQASRVLAHDPLAGMKGREYTEILKGAVVAERSRALTLVA